MVTPRVTPSGRGERSWAGHAIVAAYLGFANVWIDLEPLDRNRDAEIIRRFNIPESLTTEGAGAVTRYDPNPKWGAANKRQRLTGLLYAGAIAEELRYGRPVSDGWDDDARKLMALMSDDPEERQAQREGAAKRARRILDSHRDDLEWTAKVAQEHPALEVKAHQDEDGVMFEVAIIRSVRMPSERIEAMGPQ